MELVFSYDYVQVDLESRRLARELDAKPDTKFIAVGVDALIPGLIITHELESRELFFTGMDDEIYQEPGGIEKGSELVLIINNKTLEERDKIVSHYFDMGYEVSTIEPFLYVPGVKFPWETGEYVDIMGETSETNFSYGDLHDLSTKLVRDRLREDLKSVEKYKLIGISRGGFFPLVIIANELGKRPHGMGACSYNDKLHEQNELKVYQSIEPAEEGEIAVLIDELVDGGETMNHCKNVLEALGYTVMTYSLHLKPNASFLPDFAMQKVPREWITYDYEVKRSISN